MMIFIPAINSKDSGTRESAMSIIWYIIHIQKTKWLNRRYQIIQSLYGPIAHSSF